MPIGALKLNTTSRLTQARRAPSEIWWHTVTTQPTYATSRWGNAIQLANTDTMFLQTYASGSHRFNSQHAWTLEWFWRRTGNLNGGTTSMIGWPGVVANQLSIRRSATMNQWQLWLNGSAASDSIAITNAADTWDHVAIQSTGTGLIQVYVNGTLRNEVAFSRTDDVTGLRFDGTGMNAGAFLQIDELRVSDCVRYSGSTYTVPTAPFVDEDNLLALHHFNNTILDDFSRRQFLLTPTRSLQLGDSTTASSLYDSSITRNVTANNPGSTLSMWIRPRGAVSGSDRSTGWTFLNFNNTDGNNAAYFLQAQNNGTLRFYRHFGPSLGFEDSSTFVVNAFPVWDRWYHIVISIDNIGVCQCYINGIAMTTTINVRTDRSQGWNFLNGIQVGGRLTGTAVASRGDRVGQLWANAEFIDLATNIHRFYNNGYVFMGVDGTASGLPRPLIFHDGNTTSLTGDAAYNLNGGRTSGEFLTYNLLDNAIGTRTD